MLVGQELPSAGKVVIGGAPISQDFADEIGAGGFAPDVASATELCKKLLV